MPEVTWTQLGVIVAIAVGLATTDAAAVSRLAVAFAAKKLGLEPREITRYGSAADGDAGEST